MRGWGEVNIKDDDNAQADKVGFVHLMTPADALAATNICD